MLAFEIEVNGQPVKLIGKRDWAVLAVNVSALRDTDLEKDVPEIKLHLGGLTQDDVDGASHHFRWSVGEPEIGDIITIKVVESENPTPPDRIFDRDIQAQKEFRRQEYLRLKEEFEP